MKLGWLVLGCGCFLVAQAGCEPARQYPAQLVSIAPPTEGKKTSPPVPPRHEWMAPEAPHDIPIRFVPDSAKEWKELPEFWNHFPPPAAGMRTIHLGQSPLGAVLSMYLADQLQIIKIKVPLGLPDPTPLIPAANPPTSARWQL